MSFIETRINDSEIVFDTAGGPGFNTNVVVTHSGREKRNANWAQARGRWELGERVMHQTELDAIVKFFRAVQGRRSDSGSRTSPTSRRLLRTAGSAPVWAMAARPTR